VSSAILRDSPKPLTSVCADLPGDLERVVSRCIAALTHLAVPTR
jgi:hypothetical protein